MRSDWVKMKQTDWCSKDCVRKSRNTLRATFHPANSSWDLSITVTMETNIIQKQIHLWCHTQMLSVVQIQWTWQIVLMSRSISSWSMINKIRTREGHWLVPVSQQLMCAMLRQDLMLKTEMNSPSADSLESVCNISTTYRVTFNNTTVPPPWAKLRHLYIQRTFLKTFRIKSTITEKLYSTHSHHPSNILKFNQINPFSKSLRVLKHAHHTHTHTHTELTDERRQDGLM